jgi:hypothetical protein
VGVVGRPGEPSDLLDPVGGQPSGSLRRDRGRRESSTRPVPVGEIGQLSRQVFVVADGGLGTVPDAGIPVGDRVG